MAAQGDGGEAGGGEGMGPRVAVGWQGSRCGEMVVTGSGQPGHATGVPAAGAWRGADVALVAAIRVTAMSGVWRRGDNGEQRC